MALTSLYCKIWLFLLKQKQILKLFEMTGDSTKFMSISDYPALSEVGKTCKSILKLLEIGGTLTLVGWTIYAISKKTFIFHAWYPFQYEDYPSIYWFEIFFNFFTTMSPVLLRYVLTFSRINQNFINDF